MSIYNTPDNPVFELFYIDVEEVEIFSYKYNKNRALDLSYKI